MSENSLPAYLFSLLLVCMLWFYYTITRLCVLTFLCLLCKVCKSNERIRLSHNLFPNSPHMFFSDSLIDEFVSFYRGNGYKSATLNRFRRDAVRFQQFLFSFDLFQVEDISIPIIEQYKQSLVDTCCPCTSRYYGKRSKLSPKTVEEKIQTVKNFLSFTNYCYGVGISSDVVRIHRASSKRMDFFDWCELGEIMELIDRMEDYPVNKLRFKLVCLIGATSGLRLFEILSLRVRNVMSGAFMITGK